jgi:hypothetical protein
MASYKVVFKPSVEKDLRAVPPTHGLTPNFVHPRSSASSFSAFRFSWVVICGNSG